MKKDYNLKIKMDEIDGIGPRLEDFYLKLLNCQGGNNSQDSNCNCAIATQECYSDKYKSLVLAYLLLSEYVTVDESEKIVLDEILRDARKKAISVLRTPYVETINTLLTIARKKLKTKIAVDSNSTSHAQRYNSITMDILGMWSNIVLEVCHLGLRSVDFIHGILHSLYVRVIETAYDTFVSYKQDKDLDSLYVRVMSMDDIVNIQYLDIVINQVVAMRSTVNTHYSFHFEVFSNFFDANSSASMSLVERMVFPSLEELARWKELDMLYIGLEQGYLNRAIVSACLADTTASDKTQKSYASYLFAIEGDNVYMLQCVDDMLFLLQRSCERAIQTREETCLFAVAHKVIELLASESSSSGLLFEIITSPLVFKHSVHVHVNQMVASEQLRVLKEILQRCLGVQISADVDGDTTSQQPPHTIYKTPSKKSIEAYDANHPNEKVEEASLSRSASASASVSASAWGNVNWIASLVTSAASPYIPKETSSSSSSSSPDHLVGQSQPSPSSTSATAVTARTNNFPSSQSQSVSAPAPAPSSGSLLSLESLLLQALDAIPDDSLSVVYNDASREEVHQESGAHILGRYDSVVQNNTMAVAIAGIRRLRSTLESLDSSVDSAAADEEADLAAPSSAPYFLSCYKPKNTAAHSKGNHSIGILLKELISSEDLYERWLRTDVDNYIRREARGFGARVPFLEFLKSGFEMSGETADQRMQSSVIRTFAAAFLSSLPFSGVYKASIVSVQSSDSDISPKSVTSSSSSSSSSAAPAASAASAVVSADAVASSVPPLIQSLFCEEMCQRLISRFIILLSEYLLVVCGLVRVHRRRKEEQEDGEEGEQEHNDDDDDDDDDDERIYKRLEKDLLLPLPSSYRSSNEAALGYIIEPEEALSVPGKLNEWGAIVFQEEIRRAMRLFESLLWPLLQDTSTSILRCSLMNKLVLASKILTLDAPIDIQRYDFSTAASSSSFDNSSSSDTSEPWLASGLVSSKPWEQRDIRHILSRRSDFNQDAVASVKINLN